MTPSNTPVLLAIAGTKIGDLPSIIDNFRQYSDFTTFVVVCPPHSVPEAQRLAADAKAQVSVVDEEQVIEALRPAVILANLPPHVPNRESRGLACWYYQQFLKMGFARHTTSEYYLVWDCDTLLLQRIRLTQDGRVLLTSSNEYHRDYFRTLRRILPSVRIPRRSHISQHMLVCAAHMRELLDELSSHGAPWWRYVLSSMTGKSPQQFSEYETYAAYCLTRWPGRYRSIRRRWLRYGMGYFGTDRQAADLSVLRGLYEFVAFEGWDTGPKRRRNARRRVFLDRLGDWSGRKLGWTWLPR